MNRNLRVAQSAAELQNGALKAIHMNRNLRAIQISSHLQKSALKVIKKTKFKSCSRGSPPNTKAQ
jgi:hypothetical protein